jgi:hypothetical protein
MERGSFHVSTPEATAWRRSDGDDRPQGAGIFLICFRCFRSLREHTIAPQRDGLSFGPPLSILFQRTPAYEADGGRQRERR